jgi:hypothetical protein
MEGPPDVVPATTTGGPELAALPRRRALVAGASADEDAPHVAGVVLPGNDTLDPTA